MDGNQLIPINNEGITAMMKTAQKITDVEQLREVNVGIHILWVRSGTNTVQKEKKQGIKRTTRDRGLAVRTIRKPGAEETFGIELAVTDTNIINTL